MRGVFRHLSVVLAAASLLTGCVRGISTSREPHALMIAYAGDPASLVPFLAIDQDVIAVDALFCQTLVGLSANNRDVPILVTRVPSRQNGDISRDGTRITYHLRPDARFADGTPLTSADVAFTYRAIFDPRNRATSVEPYRRIASLQTPDAHTVVLRLKEPWNAAVRVLFAQSDYPYGILPKHAFPDTKIVGTPWENAPFGSGPFRVTQWQRGDRIVMERNPYFVPKPKLSRIVLQIVPNLNSNFVALQSGSVDIGRLTPDNVEQAAHLPGIHVLRDPENATGLLYLQTQAAPTNDIHVRRAIAYALDQNELANAWHREYPTATSFLPPPIVTWKSVTIPPYEYDLRAARAELDAAGWQLHNGVRTKGDDALTGLIGVDAENPIAVRLATLVQSELAVVGINLSVKTNPTRTWFSYSGLLRNGKAAIVTESWVGGSDPEQSLNLRCVQAVNGGSNHSYYCSKRFEELFADQARTPSQAQRDRDLNEMQLLVHRDIPVIPIYYEVYFDGVNQRVTGYQVNMLRIPVNAENWDTR